MDNSIKTFFDELLSQTGLTKSAIIQEANLARVYGYQILNGSRMTRRDNYLRIAIAMKLDLPTTQRLLAVVQANRLHPQVKRDAAIMFAIHHNYDNLETYDFMLSHDFEPLEKDETVQEDTKPDNPEK